jgi:hypothetical protein
MEAAGAELTPEEWRPVVGYEGLYSVSSLGRVRSEARILCYTRVRNKRQSLVRRVHKERILVSCPNEDGHHRVILCREGNKNYRFVHHLVMESFVGPRPGGMCVLHGAKGPSDNSLGNLRYGSYSENNGSDRYRDGTMICGVGHPRARFTEQQVRAIRTSNKHPTRLAMEYGVTVSAINHIQCRRSWKHVA